MKREFFGSSIEEALQKAGLKLGVDTQRLKYSVVEGEFGRTMPGMKVAILVEVPKGRPLGPPLEAEPKPEDKDIPEKKPGSQEWARYVLDGILGRMGVPVQITSAEKGESVILTVELKDDSLDLRRGESRELRGAIQHLVNRAASGEGESEKRFIVDIGGTLEHRREKMNDLAEQLAVKVSRLDRPVYIHLMDSQDRRIVHTAVADSQKVDTEAKGEAQFRVLRVEPRKGK